MRALWGASVVLAAGCYAGVDSRGGLDGDASATQDDAEPAGDGNDSATGGNDDGDPDDDGPACVPGASSLPRLTRAEYSAAVDALLGVPTDAPFGTDEAIGPFFVNHNAPPSEPTVDAYRREAERLAGVAAADLDGLLGCDPQADAECIERFIADFGRRAYRRPLTSDEVEQYLDVYSESVVDGAAEGVQWVVATFLQSPFFLYRVEIGTPSDDPELLALNDYEIAARLAFALWRSIPDDALLDAAADGTLNHSSGLREQIERMLDSPQFAATVVHFHREWLQLAELEALTKPGDPEFDEALAASMAREVELFVEDVMVAGDGQLSTLLTAPVSFVDGPLAALYGLEAPGEGFTRIEHDGSTRAGLLGQAAFLALNGEPDRTPEVWRGRFVRFDLLCGELPPPPADVEVQVGVDRLESAECRACHLQLDPIGFGFAAYDGLGRYSPSSGERGELHGTDVDGEFEGPAELGARLAQSEAVNACMAKHWFRFARGRDPTEADACDVENAVHESAGNLRELLLALVRSPGFSQRYVGDGA